MALASSEGYIAEMGVTGVVRAVAGVALISALASAVAVVRGQLVAFGVPLVPALATGLGLQIPMVLGVLILLRRPRLRIGWILLVAGGVTSWAAAASAVSTAALAEALGRGVPAGELGDLAAWSLVSNGLFPVAYLWPVLAALSFPDERLHRASRLVVVGSVTCTVVVAGLFAVSPTANEPFATVPNAWSVPGLAAYTTVVDLLFGVVWFGLLAGIIGGAALQARRAAVATGEQRLQLLWLAFGTALSAVALVTCGLGTVLGVIDPRWTGVVLLAVYLAVAGTITVAISRHGLYGIERLVDRTLVYAVTSIVLLAAFLGLTAALGLLLGHDRPVVTALATAAAAAIFLPVRRLVQAQVDRWWAPRTVLAVRQLRALATVMQDETVSATTVQAVLRVALDDPSLMVFLRGSDSWYRVDGVLMSDPDPGPDAASRAVTEVPYAGAPVARIDHAVGLLDQPELVRRVVAEAAAPLAQVRHQEELERRLAEVHASRARIVHAGYEARHRLERDLHDGAQQRLVALGIHLRRTQASLTGAGVAIGPRLDEAVEQVSEAIADLRDLAAGVRPPQLQDGLLTALQELAGRTPIEVELEVSDRRLPPELEDAAYFITCEAITNAIKHGSPTRVRVHSDEQAGWLRLSVSDDGPGGASAQGARGGLSGMVDRARAHGGTLDVSSPPHEGTVVRLALPLTGVAASPTRA